MNTYAHWLDALTPFEWESVDWTKTDTQISKETGRSYMVVRYHRMRLGMPKVRPDYKHSKVNWDALDWTQSDNELSRRAGINITTIRNRRIKLNKPKSAFCQNYRGESVKVTEQMIQNADWAFRRDADLALEWRTSRERVRQIRQLHGKPECDYKNQSGKTLECLRWISTNKADIEGKHLNDIIPLLPCGTRQVRLRALKKSGVRIDWTYSHPHCNPHVRIINWDLPNIALQFIWTSFSRPNGIPAARSRFGISVAKWDLRFGRAKLSGDMLQAIAAEVAKAKAAGVVPDEAGLNEWIKGKE